MTTSGKNHCHPPHRHYNHQRLKSAKMLLMRLRHKTISIANLKNRWEETYEPGKYVYSSWTVS